MKRHREWENENENGTPFGVMNVFLNARKKPVCETSQLRAEKKLFKRRTNIKRLSFSF